MFLNIISQAKQFKKQAQAKLPLDQIEAKVGIKHVEVLKELQTLTYDHTFREHLVKQEDMNKTIDTKPKLHDLHNLKIHRLTPNMKQALIDKDKHQADKPPAENKHQVKANPKPVGLLSLTNQLLNIKEEPKERLGSNKIKSEKTHSLSIADKIGLLQPNVSSLPSSKPAGPGGYHVLNEHALGVLQDASGLIKHGPGLLQRAPGPTQHAPSQPQHAPSLTQNAPSPPQHAPSPPPGPVQQDTHSNHEAHASEPTAGPVQHESHTLQHETHPAQHVPPSAQSVNPNQLQRDPHPVIEKGQNRNDISVSVSVSGEFGQPVTNETDLSGVFLKSGPDNIRSRIPKPVPGNRQMTDRNSKRPTSRSNTIAQTKGGSIPRTGVRPKSRRPSLGNTLLNWLNGALQKSASPKSPSHTQQRTHQIDGSLRSQLPQRYNNRPLGNVRNNMDNTRTSLNRPIISPVQEPSNVGIQRRPQSRRAQTLSKRSLAYNSFKDSVNSAIRRRFKRQAAGWNQDRNYYTTSNYNNEPQQNSGYSTQAYPSSVDKAQNSLGGTSTFSTNDDQNTKTSDGGNPVNTKNAYFTGIDDTSDSQPTETKNRETTASPGNTLSNQFEAPPPPPPPPLPPPPPPPSYQPSYEDNPPHRPLSPLPSSSPHPPQTKPPPTPPSTFDDYNPPHRPLSPPPSSPGVYSSFRNPSVSSYPSPPPPSPPSPNSHPPPYSYNPAPPPTRPPTARPPPPYNPTFKPAPPPYSAPPSYLPSSQSYSPAPPSPPVPTTRRPTTQPYYPAPPPSSYYPTPPSTQWANSQYTSTSYPTQPNSNSTYDSSYPTSPPPAYQEASPGYNSSTYSGQPNPYSAYNSNSSSESSYYTSSPTYQDRNPQYNSTYPTRTDPTYDSYSTSPTSQPAYQGASSSNNPSTYPNQEAYPQNNSSTSLTEGANPSYNSSAYLTPLNPNPTKASPPFSPTNVSSTNRINNNDQRTANDFNVQTVGDGSNNGLTTDYGNKQYFDYNMTTQPLNRNSNDSNSGYNNIYNPDYNLTFQNVADNLATESSKSSTTSRKTSDTSLQNNLYKDLGDSQTVVGFTNQTSDVSNRNSNELHELGKILDGVQVPHLTIDDMKKRIKEFSSGYDDNQSIGNKKTFVEQNKVNQDALAEGKYLAPMFGGDLLLAADTVKHLANFNDYIRPPIVLEDVKVLYIFHC